MYAPEAFEITDQERLWRFVEEYPFAIMITNQEEFFATHIPFSLEKAPGKPGGKDGDGRRLLGHIATANPHKAQLDGADILLIFQGPHGYVSPSWYGTRQAVPTWNYAAVHVWGTAHCFSDEARLEGVVRSLSDRFETGQRQPWNLDELAQSSRRAMLRQITGVEISVSKIAGKFKMSQNRGTEDRHSVANALASQERLEDQSLAQFMNEIDTPADNQ
jgi:transcriptional regulator